MPVELFPVFFLLPEIKSSIDTKCTKGVGNRKTRLAIIVSMQN